MDGVTQPFIFRVQLGSLKMRVCPVIVSNKATINNYTTVALSGMMYMAGVNRVPCRSVNIYDQHPISQARNLAAEEFLADKENTHLLFIDDDIVPPINIISKLLNDDKMVVSGWYLYRGNQQLSAMNRTKQGWTSLNIKQLTDKPQELISVDGCGAGCLMIKREVFNLIDKPYFLEAKDAKGVGEDLYFCSNCKAHSIPIYIDATLYCRHWTFGLL